MKHLLRDPIEGGDTIKKCKTSTQIVFLKTHKTGSSTVASIFQRFGFSHNLSFVIPRHGHMFSIIELFNRSFAEPNQKYDMLVNHVRYNRKEMDTVMKPDTKYITILRDPATQAESMFGYFKIYKYLNMSKNSNPFARFLHRPQHYMNEYKSFKMREHLQNPTLYDLGFETSKYLNRTQIQYFIENLSHEFDLVLLQEYFNESLILLKKLLCWDMDDIVYISKGVRINKLRFGQSNRLKKKARDWNSADTILYDFFNKTFWKKVSEYGPDFEKDLNLFEKKLNKTFYNCIISDEKRKVFHRSYTYALKPGSGIKCEMLLWTDIMFLLER
ncbi:galactosylceramide sulfotransferase-like [Antedon mediterranea]|uniref:galactosylceramide sulfotransferase-like n=1 Tax=Antedon mediterranea TaxID=105859 RepID=UPI003AF7DD78